MKVCIINKPKELEAFFHGLSALEFIENPIRDLDFILLFADSLKQYEKQFVRLSKTLKSNGMLWVAWPKKASKVTTDLTENIIRDFGLLNGMVDVKVCAIDERWSGLKFVIRVKDRTK